MLYPVEIYPRKPEEMTLIADDGALSSILDRQEPPIRRISPASTSGGCHHDGARNANHEHQTHGSLPTHTQLAPNTHPYRAHSQGSRTAGHRGPPLRPLYPPPLTGGIVRRAPTRRTGCRHPSRRGDSYQDVFQPLAIRLPLKLGDASVM